MRVLSVGLRPRLVIPVVAIGSVKNHDGTARHESEIAERGHPEFRRKALLARLVPERRPPRERPRRPAEKRQRQQRRFRNPPLPPARTPLVPPERREGEQVDREEDEVDPGWLQQGEDHAEFLREDDSQALVGIELEKD